MASIILTPSGVANPSTTRSVKWGMVGRTGLAATMLSAFANLVVYYLGDAVIGYDPEFIVLQSASGIAFCTVVLAIIAVLVHAALLRFTDKPVRNFRVVSAVTLLLSFIPDFTILRSEPGFTVAQALVLCLMHVVAAGVIVGTLTGKSYRRS